MNRYVIFISSTWHDMEERQNDFQRRHSVVTGWRGLLEEICHNDVPCKHEKRPSFLFYEHFITVSTEFENPLSPPGVAGKQWGTLWIPRIGQEVIVSFLEGDHDRPIITGAVFNPDCMPPYTLPDNKTRGTIKTNSSVGGGGFNEIRFEDKKGNEQICMHAEKDIDLRVKNDYMEAVLNNRNLIVLKDHLEEVRGDRHVTLRADRATEITGSDSLKLGATQDVKISTKYAVDSGQEIHFKAGIKMILEAGTQLSLKVGGNFIDIGPAGVSIKGTMVNINGVSAVDVTVKYDVTQGEAAAMQIQVSTIELAGMITGMKGAGHKPMSTWAPTYLDKQVRLDLQTQSLRRSVRLHDCAAKAHTILSNAMPIVSLEGRLTSVPGLYSFDNVATLSIRASAEKGMKSCEVAKVKSLKNVLLSQLASAPEDFRPDSVLLESPAQGSSEEISSAEAIGIFKAAYENIEDLNEPRFRTADCPSLFRFEQYGWLPQEMIHIATCPHCQQLSRLFGEEWRAPTDHTEPDDVESASGTMDADSA